jgi:division protein CdvB (Snf7/Vps24/ESCRT-III family)
LNDDVVYEEVDDRVNEIFREYFPEDKSIEDYVPTISSRNFKNWNCRGTSYTVCLSKTCVDVLSDESVEKAKKQSSEMMKKLNDEGLISAFYDISSKDSFF